MTAQTLVDRIRRNFSGLTEAEALEYLQEAHTHILGQIRLNIETVSISLTADTREYALDNDILRVWNAMYLTSATQGFQLVPTHVDRLDSTTHRWRIQGSSQPREWYVEESNLGLYPTPDTTTSGSYPAVSLEVTRDQTLSISGTPTTIPEFARRPHAWVAEACRWVALAKKDYERSQFFTQLAQSELAQLSRDVVGRNPGFHPSFQPRNRQTRVGRV